MAVLSNLTSGPTAAPTPHTKSARPSGYLVTSWTYFLAYLALFGQASAIKSEYDDIRRHYEHVHGNQTGFNEGHEEGSENISSMIKILDSRNLYQRAPKGHAVAPANIKLPHLDSMIEGISQDLFFADNEFNFHEAHSLEWFNDWARKHNSEFLQRRSSGKKLAVDTFFIEKFFGPLGFKCNQNGCTNHPRDHDIKNGRDRHEARHLLNMIRSFEKANAEVRQYTVLLQEVKEEVTRLCKDFSETFFHGKTKGKKELCPAEVVEITFGILALLVTLGIAWEAMAPVSMTLVTQLVGMQFARNGAQAVFNLPRFGTTAFMERHVFNWMAPISPFWEGSPFTSSGFVRAYEMMYPRPSPFWRRTLEEHKDLTKEQKDAVAVFNKFIEDGLSKDYPVLRNNAKSDSTTDSTEYGGFGLMEHFNSTELNDDESSIYDQAKVGSGYGFLTYPRPLPEHEVPKQDGSLTNGKLAPNGRSVHRVTRLFDITSNSQNELLRTGSSGEFVDIVRRLVHEDGSPMSHAEVFGFFESQVQNITARSRELRGPAVTFPSEYVPVKKADLRPNVKIASVDQHFPWATILSGLKFDGHGGASYDLQSAQFRWRTNAADSSSGNQKRDLQFEASGHVRHEISGMLSSLQAINVLDPPSSNGRAKRDTKKWDIQKRQDKNGDVFTADVSEHYFRNEIKHQKCGMDNYTGDKEKNKRACEAYINNVVQSIVQRMSRAYTTANYDSPIAMAEYLQKKFSTYSTWRNADRIYVPAVKAKVKNNLQNSLVSKAYADGNCFIRCGTSTSYTLDTFGPSVDYPGDKNVYCQTGCYDPIKNTYERLYGFDGATKISEGRAANEPWNLDETVINKISTDAYRSRMMANYNPANVNLDPYAPQYKDVSPVLPVCYSRLNYQGHMPCNCGNEYGDKTSEFASLVNLRAEGKKNEWKAIDSCLKQLKPLAKKHPAAYLLNSCNVIYQVVAPKGKNSAQEKDDLGHYKHNYGACKIYWEFYKNNTHLDDMDMNRGICELWTVNAKDLDRGLNHKHPDFSYVNDMMEDEGCWGYLGR